MKIQSLRTPAGKFRVEITRTDGSRAVYQTDYRHPFSTWPDWKCVEGIPCPTVISPPPTK